MTVKHIAVLVLTLASSRSGQAQQYDIATIAGGTLPVSGVPAAQASIGDPPRVATDAAGTGPAGRLLRTLATTNRPASTAMINR